jgi:ABC-type cobalt transport system substrate-binding protein
MLVMMKLVVMMMMVIMVNTRCGVFAGGDADGSDQMMVVVFICKIISHISV